MLIEITVHNRGDEAATLHLLPTLWFRNDWSWVSRNARPQIEIVAKDGSGLVLKTAHRELEPYWLYGEATDDVLFTENETNMALVGTVALLTAAFLLVARIFRLGFLADFLSRTVLVGFLAGVGIQVGIAMLPDMEEIVTDVFTWTWFSEPHGYNFNGHLVRYAEGNLCIDPVQPTDACRTSPPICSGP